MISQASHVSMFLNYLNEQHARIKFTVELEKDNMLPFLDCKVTKTTNGFQTSSYRKPTYSGQGMKFNSAISDKYKFSLIDCLIDRAYKINSTVTCFCKELQRHIRNFFTANGYNIFTLESRFAKKLDSIKNPKIKLSTADKKVIYGKVSFMSNWHNKQFEKDMNQIVKEFFPTST